MAKFSNSIYSLGFGTPGFQSPARGSGVRFGRVIPKRARLTRLRGLGDASDFLDWGSGNSESIYGPVSLPPTGSVDISLWGTNELPGAQTTQVPASGGGTTSVQSSVLSDITNLLRLGQQAVAQQRILDLNIARARQGLPMIDPRYFSPSAAVNFGLTPDATKMLLIGGGALLVILMLSRRKG